MSDQFRRSYWKFWVFGNVLQASFMLILLFQSWRSYNEPTPYVLLILGAVGTTALVVVSGWITYFLCKDFWRLQTGGVFKYVRHPMYNCILLIMPMIWWQSPDEFWWLLVTMFTICFLAAGYLQEREVLMRFGKEAEEYYQRTPRFIFLYPLMRMQKRR